MPSLGSEITLQNSNFEKFERKNLIFTRQRFPQISHLVSDLVLSQIEHKEDDRSTPLLARNVAEREMNVWNLKFMIFFVDSDLHFIEKNSIRNKFGFFKT